MLKNMKIGNKIVTGFMALLAIFIIVCGSFTINLTQFKKAADMNNHTYEVKQIYEHLLEKLVDMETGARGYVITGDESFLEPYQSGKQIYQNHLNDLLKLSSDNPTQTACLNEISISGKAFEKVLENSINLKKTSTMEVVIETVKKQLGKKSMDKLRVLIAQGIKTEDDLLAIRTEAMYHAYMISILSIIIGLLASVIAALIISRSIAKSISRPLNEMAVAAQRMSEGDLGVQIHVDNAKNEIGQLSIAFSESIYAINSYISDIKDKLAEMAQGDLNIVSKLDYKGDFVQLKKSIHGIVVYMNDAMVQMNQVSEQVSTGSEQVSDGAQELAQGAAEQANAIEELSASISEISAHIKDNAAHATDVSAHVNHVGSEIEISNNHMKKMISAMSQINESSSEIGKIIKTIEDIAFQTNILALNAAVEAARAGEAGKGFAIVADEVRNLASKSAAAAKDTTALIENSMKQVENGTKIADETAKSLIKVVASSDVVAETVEKISQASTRQAEAVAQITLGMEQISSVVQNNSATAEESAASSEELSGQVQIMRSLVKKFKLRNQEEEDERFKVELARKLNLNSAESNC
jgi:X-X-X-Leu-X-X-Gly heptad repeat protein